MGDEPAAGEGPIENMRISMAYLQREVAVAHSGSRDDEPGACRRRGVGRIGRMHASILARQIPGATVVAVVDAFPDTAAQVAEELRARPLSVDEMFAESDIDAVAICTSSDTHVDLVVRAAEGGQGDLLREAGEPGHRGGRSGTRGGRARGRSVWRRASTAVSTRVIGPSAAPSSPAPSATFILRASRAVILRRRP